VIVFMLATAAVGIDATPVSADCCIGGASQPSAFHVRALPGGPVALQPITVVEVSSEAPADYSARVDIEVGGKVLARTTGHGHSTTGWSRLRIPLTRGQRHRIITAAHREGRRAILAVQLRGTLAGHAHPDVRYVLLVMSGPGMPAATELPDAGADQRTRISLAYAVVRGASQHLRGRIVVRTPRATFSRTNRDASQSAHFDVALSGSCRATVLVYPAASATRVSAVAQIDGSLRGSRLLAGGHAADGSPWGIGEFALFSQDTGQPIGGARITGVRIVRVAPRRWLRLAEYVSFSSTCSTTDATNSRFVDALGRLLSLAETNASITTLAR
jgi:hypothetical protein